MVALDISEHVFRTHASGLSLLNSAKCYKPRMQESRKGTESGVVLMLAHGTGYHKEHWEPTLAHLFDIDLKNTSRAPFERVTRIREAWAIDVQTHGKSAELNERVLAEDPDAWSIWDYADAFATLRRDVLGTNPSYSDNKFVLVAHSASATGVILATTFFPIPQLYPRIFHSLILIEPAVVPPHFVDPSRHTPLYRAISDLMASRKDTWASKEYAKEWMSQRIPWGGWDDDVLEIYVQHGLRSLPDGTVTLRCPKKTETLAYDRGIRQSLPGLWQLNLLCNANAHAAGSVGVLPIHVVWGEIDDLFSREVKDSLEDREQGRMFTSVRRVPDAGHMMVQVSPGAVSETLWDILLEGDDRTKSKL